MDCIAQASPRFVAILTSFSQELALQASAPPPPDPDVVLYVSPCHPDPTLLSASPSPSLWAKKLQAIGSSSNSFLCLSTTFSSLTLKPLAFPRRRYPPCLNPCFCPGFFFLEYLLKKNSFMFLQDFKPTVDSPCIWDEVQIPRPGLQSPL